MTHAQLAAVALALVACAGSRRVGGMIATTRPACAAEQRWNGAACVSRGDGPARVVEGAKAVSFQPDAALMALDAAAAAGPLDYASYVHLWEQRGIAHAFLEDDAAATSAFAMLLALDPGHLLSCKLPPKATWLFLETRSAAAAHDAPTIDVGWPRGLRAGQPVPVEIEVVADPASFLATASLFVRRRGEPRWRAADFALPPVGGYRRVVLPGVDIGADTALEVYLRAYDRAGNEVLTWASPERPRDIPLAWDPPTLWYRRWWVWAIAGSVVAGVTGGVVYAATREPPQQIDGEVTVGTIPIEH